MQLVSIPEFGMFMLGQDPMSPRLPRIADRLAAGDYAIRGDSAADPASRFIERAIAEHFPPDRIRSWSIPSSAGVRVFRVDPAAAVANSADDTPRRRCSERGGRMFGVEGFLYIVLLSIGLGLASLARTRGRHATMDRLGFAALPPLAAVFALFVAADVAQAPMFFHNSLGLTATVALARGFPIYGTPDSGPILNAMYPPFSAVAYLPAAIWTRPEPIYRGAALLAQLYDYLPVLLLFLGATRRAPDAPDRARTRAMAVGGLLLFGFATRNDYGLHACSSWTRADAPAMGFLMAAVAVLVAKGGGASPSIGRSAAVGILAWTAVWSKQTMAPGLLVPPVWVALAHGRRAGIRFGLAYAVAGVPVAFPFLAAFDVDALIFNAWTFPKRYPWAGEAPLNVLVQTLELTYRSAAMMIPIGAWAYRSAPPAGPRGRLSAIRWTLRRSPWLLPAGIGLAMFPTSVLGVVKVGGFLNCFGPTLYFLLASFFMLLLRVITRASRTSGPTLAVVPLLGAGAMCVLLLDAVGQIGNGDRHALLYPMLAGAALTAMLEGLRMLPRLSPSRLRTVQALGLSALVVVFAAMGQEKLRIASGQAALLRDPSGHRPRIAYQFLKRFPGMACFPYDPIAHLLAEGRLCHAIPSVIEREFAGYPVAPDHLRSGQPPDYRLLCLPPAEHAPYGEQMPSLFPEFYHQVTLRPLRSFRCYTRQDEALDELAAAGATIQR